MKQGWTEDNAHGFLSFVLYSTQNPLRDGHTSVVEHVFHAYICLIYEDKFSVPQSKASSVFSAIPVFIPGIFSGWISGNRAGRERTLSSVGELLLVVKS